MTATVADATGTPERLRDASTTPERLLDAAERLVAERGLAAVSVRAVNAAAGTNVAAVHYHFGSKEALVDAVLRRRMDGLGARRLALLAALPDRDVPVRAVVEALVLPLAELSADPEGAGRAYVRVLCALDGGGPDARRALTNAFAPQFGAFDGALARALPDLPAPVRHFRLGLVGTTVAQTLADPERGAATLGGGDQPIDHREVVEALVDTVTGALAAPVTTPPAGGAP